MNGFAYSQTIPYTVWLNADLAFLAADHTLLHHSVSV